jgi:tetratricopeptide (TPR) repeat protein
VGLLQVQNLVNEGNLDEALQEIETLEQDDLIMGDIYKSCIELEKNHLTQSLNTVTLALAASRENERWLEEFCASSLNSLILIKQESFEEAIRFVEQAELLQDMLSSEQKEHCEFWIQILNYAKGLVEYNQANFKQSLEYHLSNYDYYQLTKNRSFLLQILYQLGNIYYEEGKYNFALSYFHEKLLLMDENNYTLELILLYEKLGTTYLEKGQYDLAHYFLSLTDRLFQEKKDQVQAARINQLIGMLHINRGHFDLAFEYFQKSISIQEKLGTQEGTGWSLLQVAFAQFKKGDLFDALKSYQDCLAKFSETDDQIMYAWTLKSIGEIYHRKGEYKTALEYYQRNIGILKEINNKYGLADGFNKIGEVYYNKNELNSALNYFQQSLSIYIKIGDIFESTDTIFNLIKIKLEMKSINQAKYFLNMLKDRSERTQNQHIQLKCRVAEALYLKYQKRITDKIEAQKIFSQIITEEVIDHELTILATLNLCELLISELHAYQEDVVLQELKYHLAELYEIAQEQKSFILLVEVLLLQAKFALIEGNADLASKLTDQAEITVVDYDLKHLLTKVTKQQDNLRDSIELWDELNRRNASIRERIELAEIDGYLEKVFKMPDVM